MARLVKKTISSFRDFVVFIEQVRSSNKGPIWYRGCTQSTHMLKPTLYRHPKINTFEKCMILENRLMTRFRQRSIPFHTRPLTDIWEILFFMQHSGIPTRLLDWTENPFFGLFFAVMNAPYSLGASGVPKFKSEVAVWFLDPIKWNQHALRNSSFKGEVLTPFDAELNAYKPILDYKNMSDTPVAIFGVHNSQRIVAQRGVFIVFGKNVTPMERLFEEDNFPQGCLIKTIFGKRALRNIRKALIDHGITDSVVFPELEGLAREMKREFGFEV